MILKFKVKNTTLSRINDINSGQNNPSFYKCKFYCDRQTWQGKKMFAAFTNSIGYTQISSLGQYDDVLSCALPQRMISEKYFKVYVYAKDSIKTNTISLTLKNQCKTQSKKTDALNHILSQLETKIDTIQYSDNQLKCYSNNELIDTIFIDNVDDALVEKQIRFHFENFEKIINDKLDKHLTEDDITFQNGILYIK